MCKSFYTEAIWFYFSHSVLQYLPSHNYAPKVIDSLAKMTKKCCKIAVLISLIWINKKIYVDSKMINTRQIELEKRPSPIDFLAFDNSLLSNCITMIEFNTVGILVKQ